MVLHGKRPPFSRSYGGILPSSLTTVRSIASVFSTRPPELVWGTGRSELARGFSRQHRIIPFTALGYASGLTLHVRRICLPDGPHPCTGTTTHRPDYLPASPHRLPTTSPGPQLLPPHTRRRGAVSVGQHRWGQDGRSFAGAGTSTRCPSTTPVGLALGPDSPWAD